MAWINMSRPCVTGGRAVANRMALLTPKAFGNTSDTAIRRTISWARFWEFCLARDRARSSPSPPMAIGGLVEFRRLPGSRGPGASGPGTRHEGFPQLQAGWCARSQIAYRRAGIPAGADARRDEPAPPWTHP